MLLKAFAGIFLFGLARSSESCDLPPELWCSTPETAKRCQVYSQCNDYYTVQGNATPVNLTLYHESLCPDCLRFITTSLWTAFNKVPSIFTITSVPYGNAEEKREPFSHKYKYECQHGKAECVGNFIESCIDFLIKNKTQVFVYTHCIASYLKNQYSENVPKAAEKCASELGIQYNQINTCANGNLGMQLEHQNAVRTNALNPPHTYVPWVTINGVHTEDIEQKAEKDLVKLICDTYKGPKPSGCQETVPKRNCLKKDL